MVRDGRVLYAVLLALAGCGACDSTAAPADDQTARWEEALQAARVARSTDPDALLSAYDALKPGLRDDQIQLDAYDRERVAKARCARGASQEEDEAALEDLKRGVELGGCDGLQRARLREILAKRGLPESYVRGLGNAAPGTR